jgi:signal transduction histidine kinase
VADALQIARARILRYLGRRGVIHIDADADLLRVDDDLAERPERGTRSHRLRHPLRPDKRGSAPTHAPSTAASSPDARAPPLTIRDRRTTAVCGHIGLSAGHRVDGLDAARPFSASGYGGRCTLETVNESAPPSSTQLTRAREAFIARMRTLIDRYAPPELFPESPDDAHRARLFVGIALLLTPVIAVLSFVRIAYADFRGCVLNGLLAGSLALTPWLLRKTKRLALAVNSVLGFAYIIVVAGALFARGAGLTSATVALAELPLFGALLGGVRSGAHWAVLATLTGLVIGLLGHYSFISDRLPQANALFDDHATLVVITVTLFLIGALFEYWREEGQRQIAALEKEKHRAEREHLEAKADADLARAERLASMGRLAAAAAHEINNPLSYVANNLDFLRGTLPGADGESVEAVREAQDGVDRIRRIVAELGSLSRGEPDSVESVDAVAAILTALRMSQGHTRQKARVTTYFEAVPHVAANELRLVQALLNLVVNAAQAIAEGHVSTNRIDVSVRPSESDFVCIEVRDTGSGIAPEVLENVKEPFFTTKPLGEGTGLGLALADGIVRRYGGRLELESSHAGTAARVFLRVSHAEPPARLSTRAALPPGPVTQPLRVLVIDDEPLVARAFARILRGHDITLAVSGREALALLLGDKHYDLVFCDVMMPDLSGMGVFHALRPERPDLADELVFMTGGTFTELARTFRQTVNNRFIEKPIDPVVVSDLIRERTDAIGARALDGAS